MDYLDLELDHTRVYFVLFLLIQYHSHKFLPIAFHYYSWDKD